LRAIISRLIESHFFWVQGRSQEFTIGYK